jgi:putative membrane protein
MKQLAYLGAVVGLLLLTALVAYEGWPAIAAAFKRAGWPLLLLVPAHVVPLTFDMLAWHVLLGPVDAGRRAGRLFLLWVAAVREAVSRLLPAIGIAGEVVGVRLVRARVVDTTGITATVIIEVLVTIAMLYLYSGLGVILMVHIAAGLSQLWVIATALLLSLPLPVLVYWLLRHGNIFARLQAWITRLLGPQNRLALSIDGARLDAEVGLLFGRPWLLARALGWQIVGYLLGSFETWFALRLLGHPVDVQTAIAIEALTQASRHAAFLVPAGLGVQDAAVLLFGILAGVGGDVGLSLALVRRMREILFGVPALLSWQWFEAHRLRQRDAALR